mmetsp:Transcript_35452/g.67884  ORF Transcript_35452/g.67884 Transcript_35452/m.67884 type:complete len:274 (-) Transcript_35452:261-1082(-)
MRVRQTLGRQALALNIKLRALQAPAAPRAHARRSEFEDEGEQPTNQNQHHRSQGLNKSVLEVALVGPPLEGGGEDVGLVRVVARAPRRRVPLPLVLPGSHERKRPQGQSQAESRHRGGAHRALEALHSHSYHRQVHEPARVAGDKPKIHGHPRSKVLSELIDGELPRPRRTQSAREHPSFKKCVLELLVVQEAGVQNHPRLAQLLQKWLARLQHARARVGITWSGRYGRAPRWHDGALHQPQQQLLSHRRREDAQRVGGVHVLGLVLCAKHLV